MAQHQVTLAALDRVRVKDFTDTGQPLQPNIDLSMYNILSIYLLLLDRRVPKFLLIQYAVTNLVSSNIWLLLKILLYIEAV